MLSKLLKYEFRSTSRIFFLCYAVLLGISFFVWLMGELVHAGDWWLDSPLMTILYNSAIVAVAVITFVLVLTRFYKNLLGGEGYLMHTLPVRPWEHILSKLIAAIAWSVLSAVVVAVSLVIIATGPLDWPKVFETLSDLANLLESVLRVPFPLLLLETIVLALLTLTADYLRIYAAIMIGHQATKHRILLAVGAYFAFEVIGGMVLNVVILFIPSDFFDSLPIVIDRIGVGTAVQLVFLGLAAYGILRIVVFFAITEYLMRRRLNLE